MELWIRSQDKEELVKCERITLYTIQYNFETINYRILVNNVCVGSYATKERVLEVLDEIQDLIKPTLINTEYHSEIKQGVNNLEFDVVMQPIADKITYIQPNSTVYEMPEE